MFDTVSRKRDGFRDGFRRNLSILMFKGTCRWSFFEHSHHASTDHLFDLCISSSSRQSIVRWDLFLSSNQRRIDLYHAWRYYRHVDGREWEGCITSTLFAELSLIQYASALFEGQSAFIEDRDIFNNSDIYLRRGWKRVPRDSILSDYHSFLNLWSWRISRAFRSTLGIPIEEECLPSRLSSRLVNFVTSMNLLILGRPK